MTTKIIAIVLIVVSVLTLALPAFAASYVYAKYDGVGIWDDPNRPGASPMTRVPYGGKMTVLDSSAPSGFVHVCYNGYYGYVDKGDVTSKDPNAKPSPTKKAKKTEKKTENVAKPVSLYAGFNFVDKYVKVAVNKNGSQLNMRWAPTTAEDNVIASYDDGAVLHVIAVSNGWVQVLDEENWRVGFMYADYLIDADEPAASSDTLG